MSRKRIESPFQSGAIEMGPALVKRVAPDSSRFIFQMSWAVFASGFSGKFGGTEELTMLKTIWVLSGDVSGSCALAMRTSPAANTRRGFAPSELMTQISVRIGEES